MQVKYIVQDLETFEFLYPHENGDVGYTPLIKMAGHFDEIEDAMQAGQDIGAPFTVFTFYMPN